MPLADCVAATRTYTLHPGDVVLAERGDRVETLLGSCIAIALTDPRYTIGAMCHFVHHRQLNAERRPDTTYADWAVAEMYRLLRQRGINPLLCVAYVVGGGNMFPHIVTARHVGQDNARWALARLAEDGIHVVHQDTGGSHYRRMAWTVGPELPAVEHIAV
jgi:chemotaxis protein CheD